jgi:hypothetical protein
MLGEPLTARIDAPQAGVARVCASAGANEPGVPSLFRVNEVGDSWRG